MSNNCKYLNDDDDGLPDEIHIVRRIEDHPGKSAAMLMMAAMMGAGVVGRRRSHKDPLDDIDLEAEYKLIQQKRSKLSANMRRRVVAAIDAAKIN